MATFSGPFDARNDGVPFEGELPAQEIDLSAGANVTDTITGDTVYTFGADFTAGIVVTLRLIISGALVTSVTFPASAVIVGSGAVAYNDGDVSVITFCVFDPDTPIVHVAIAQEA